MSIELVHLCDGRVVLREPIFVPESPVGTQMIFEIEHAEFEGDRLRASKKANSASGDWAVVDPRGVVTLDVRLMLETHDGAVIFTSYRGRSDVSSGTVYGAPLYDTGDDRYQWLNSIQAVSKGRVDGNVLHYEVYEAR